MRLIKLDCPNCGGILQVNDQLKKCTCNYCGHAFYFDEVRDDEDFDDDYEDDEEDYESEIDTDLVETEMRRQQWRQKVSGGRIPQEYKNALTKAKRYETELHMSKMGIYIQLVSKDGEGFPPDAAQYGADNVVANWNENALVKSHKYYYEMSMSKNAVYHQLTSRYGGQFLPEEAKYAVDHLED